MSYGYHEGYCDSDEIYYCPSCGAEIGERYADGTAKCHECGLRFAVIATDDEKE